MSNIEFYINKIKGSKNYNELKKKFKVNNNYKIINNFIEIIRYIITNLNSNDIESINNINKLFIYIKQIIENEPIENIDKVLGKIDYLESFIIGTKNQLDKKDSKIKELDLMIEKAKDIKILITCETEEVSDYVNTLYDTIFKEKEYFSKYLLKQYSYRMKDYKKNKNIQVEDLYKHLEIIRSIINNDQDSNKKDKKYFNEITKELEILVLNNCNTNDIDLLNNTKFLKLSSTYIKEVMQTYPSYLKNKSDDCEKELYDYVLKEYIKQILNKITNIKSYIKSMEEKNIDDEFKHNEYESILEILKKLEVLVLYNSKKRSEEISTNLVHNILFEEKNYNFTRYLIEQYPVLINNYDKLLDNGIIDLIVKEYISNINNYAQTSDKGDLYYYDNLLELLLSNSRIKIEIKKNTINDILSFSKMHENNEKEKGRLLLWSNNLLNRLLEENYTPDEDTLNHLYGIRYYFKKSILDEANLYGYTNCPNILNLGSKNFENKKLIEGYSITIDDEETFDRDDAISVIKLPDDIYRLKIHISDVNSFAPLDSFIMKEAKKRTETIYLPDKNIYMFPETVIRKYLSLDENRMRLARTYIYDLDKYGELVNFSIEKTIIKVSNNLSYDKANEILKSTNNPKLEKTFDDLTEVSRRILKSLDLNGKNTILDSSSFSSENLIQIFMIFNNCMTAKYFKDNNLPFLYRHHQLNKDLNNCGINLEELKSKDKDKYLRIIKGLESINLPAEYSAFETNHEGMNLQQYSNTTSPGRRYGDIITNDCEDKFYFNTISDQEAYSFMEELKEDAKYLNKRTKEIEEYYSKYTRIRGKSIDLEH